MSNQIRQERAAQLYALFLKLYPQEHQQEFGSQMLQTFKDHYSDLIVPGKQAEVRFWFDVVSDEARGILREYFAILKERTAMKNFWANHGVLFGLILGIIYVGYDLVSNLAPANLTSSLTLNNLLNLGFPLAALIFTVLAGYVASHRTGKMKTGIYAGLTTSLLSWIISTCALFVITFIFIGIIRQNASMLNDFRQSGLKNMDEFIIEDALGGTLLSMLFLLLVGGIFGTVGGYLGSTLKGLKNDEQ